MPSTLLHFGRDDQGINADAPYFPTDIYTATLAADTAASVTVPSNSSNWIMVVRLQPDSKAWVSRTTTAAEPTDGTLTASASELAVGTLEYRRSVFAGDVISFLTPDTTCELSVAFYISYP